MIYFVSVSELSVHPDFSKPFVFFRHPGTTNIHYWKSHEQAVSISVETAIKSEDDWWVVAPFLFFQSQQLWAFQADEKTIFQPHELTEWQILASDISSKSPSVEDTKESDFKEWVNIATHEMRAGRFSKTALSKIKRKSLPSDYNWMHWFGLACERFPNALVFFVHIPHVYTWAGATPELFLSVNENLAQSVSLAGTLHPDSNDEWGNKEREEQMFVTRYITDVFIKSGFVDVEVSGPETISFGLLQHLKTTFQTANYLNSPLVTLIQALHPTPAVGGLPKKDGVDFILKNEKHERLWYSGFIGRMKKDKIDLFVNLRSMMVVNNAAVLYAGAGITAQSSPDAEWIETENKLLVNWELLQ